MAKDKDTIPADLQTFHVELSDGARVELRYSWPAIEQITRWLGLAWWQWDTRDHTQLSVILAGGMLHADPDATADTLAPRLAPWQFARYAGMAEDAYTYAHTGKTRAQRQADAEKGQKKAKHKAQEDAGPGEA